MSPAIWTTWVAAIVFVCEYSAANWTMWVADCCVCVCSAHGEQQEIPRQQPNPYQYNGADYDKEGPRGDIQLEEGEEEGKFSLLLSSGTNMFVISCYLLPFLCKIMG
jgi:hypothetical protein